MENKTWLDQLYLHPRRDELLVNYISSYAPGNDIAIKEAVLTTNENGENILDVTYTTLYYMTQLLPPLIAHCDMSDKPLEIHLLIGEYFVQEKGDNIVKATVHVGESLKATRGRYFKHKINCPPTYMFNATGRMLGGKSEHYLIKALEKLNEGIIIDNETFSQMLKRKCEPIMKKMIEEDPSKQDKYLSLWNMFFQDAFHYPLSKFFKVQGIFLDDKNKNL